MKWVQGIDEPLFVADGDAELPDEKKLRMGNNKLLTIRCTNGERPKPTAQPLLQFLHIHILNLSQTIKLVKISLRRWRVRKTDAFRPPGFLSALQQHWPEYLIEAWAVGTFMVSAALVTALLEHPSSPVHQLLPNDNARRALIGLAMGLTAIGLIYSPWGQQSGAHMNPATTLTFLRLGKVQP